MRLIQIAVAAFAISSLSISHAVRAETLGSVLSTHNVPLINVPEHERQQAITSFAISESDSPFLLAYYDDDGSGFLPPLLHVLRYDAARSDLRRADLVGVEPDGPFNGFAQVMTQVSNICLGSAMLIAERGEVIIIHTHINPSAGCVLILNPDLTFSAGLWGWVLGNINRQLIVQEDTVHFASTHPAALFVYDSHSKKATHIYPAENDPARQEFSEALEKALPSDEWCREANNACDPETFDTEIDRFEVDERANEFSFNAVMDPEGFGDKAEETVPSQTIHYVCRLRKGAWVLDAEPLAQSLKEKQPSLFP